MLKVTTKTKLCKIHLQKQRETDALPWDIAHNILQHVFLARIQQQKSKHDKCNTMHALDELPHPICSMMFRFGE